MEQQAVIVAMWFTGALRYRQAPEIAPMSEKSPWFRYIAGNIWAGNP